LLQATPGNYELVRRVLGHKALGTTTRFYVAFESMSAMLRYHEILATPPGEDGAVRP
jgi:hypothetical protein